LKRRDPNDEERKNGVMNVLEELEVYEVSVVTVPANQNAQVTDIKSAIETAVKAGRRNSKSDEDTIKECIAMLQSLIEDRVDDIPEEEEPDEEVAPEANEASEEPKAVDNSKRASDLLEKIKNMKEVPEDES
jgi:Arc/MetJ-type ribon-helix-helix transcriptional regulator